MKTKRIARFYGLLIIFGIFLFHTTINNIFNANKACIEGCFLQLMKHPYSELNKELVDFVRKEFVEAPPDVIEEPIQRNDYNDPIWKENGRWKDIKDLLKWIFHDLQNLTYIDFGAGVGDILSMTAWLESENGWRGLLVEPNPSSYARLRRRRNATSANVCASVTGSQYQTELWIPSNSESFQEPYRSIAGMNSRIINYVSKKDLNQGTTIPIQCLNVRTLIAAAAPYFLQDDDIIYLVVLDTNGGETYIMQDLTDYEIGVLVIRNIFPPDRGTVKLLAEDINLSLLTTSSHHLEGYDIYVNKKIDIKIDYA